MLHHESYGKGQPVVILHGLFGAGENWRGTASKLSGWQTLAPDLPSHGRSDALPTWSHDRAASSILKWADKQGLDKFPLVGHSLGGKVAMKIADIAADRISNLIIADIAPIAYPPHHKHIFEALAGIDLQALENRRQAEQQLEQGGVTMKMVRQFLLKSLYRDDENFAWRFDVPGLKANQQAISGAPSLTQQFGGPTTLIYGADSTYIDQDGLKALHKYYPQAEMECIENAGHWLHVEQPQAFVNTLLAALARG
ncbi:alpha/beta fold hydrolase [Salinibius halmophilus]|uniref:alpha/beta fold hydrolase n=1 Tax=Salinibius halmophilus TaxID=1853216 RepID=UPI000E65F06F|nr:alpha/beta fold hydrolase [Salinibius halmophilus]